MNDVVSRIEFEALKEEVRTIKEEMSDNSRLLQAIDKKIDVINEKIITNDKIDDLKYAPIEKRVKKLEDGSEWLKRTLGATIIGIVIKIIFDVSKIVWLNKRKML